MAGRGPGARRRVRLLHDLSQRVRRTGGHVCALPYIEVVYLIIGLVVVCVRPGSGRPGARRAGGRIGAVTRIACQQLAPVIGDLDGQPSAGAGRDLGRRSSDGAEVVVLPELITPGTCSSRPRRPTRWPSPAITRCWREWAAAAARARHRARGRLLRARRRRPRCTTAPRCSTPTGLRAVYRKLHLWDREKLCSPRARAAAGDRHPGRPVAVIICYDLEFPELTRSVALGGHAAAARADQLAAVSRGRTASARPRR